MLDIQFIRDNRELVARKAQEKQIPADINALLRVDEERRGLLQAVEALRAKRNENAASLKGGKPEQSVIEQGKHIKAELVSAEEKLSAVEAQYEELLSAVPNITPDDTPLGDEKANRPEKHWGNTEPKNFEIQDHLSWGESRGLIDFERGAKVSGSKFYFLKGSLAQLDLAVVQLGMQVAIKHGFTPMLVQHHATNKLHVEVAHAKHAGRGFADDGKGIGQNSIQRLFFKPVF